MRQQRGFALMLAIFLIVTLAAIAGYLLTISSGQMEAAAQDEQATRAYHAARSGIEWGAYRVLQDNIVCPPPPPPPPPPPVPTAILTLPGGFFAEVICAETGSETEGAQTVRMFVITSKGCNTNPCGALSATYVERELELTLGR